MINSTILNEEGLIRPEALHIPEIKDCINYVHNGDKLVVAVHMILYPYSPYSSIHQDKIEEEVDIDFPEYAEGKTDPNAQVYIERLKNKLIKIYETPSK